MESAALETKALTKVFGSNVANDHISLELKRGEIMAIIGENGAGKSTFCKMLTGVYQPDSGDIIMDGEKKRFHSVRESMEAGIGMVYQERNLIPMLNGAQNICLGAVAGGSTILNEKKIMEEALKIRDQLRLTIPLDVPVEQLGAGEQQLIEIMRALYLHPRILILDEPTASLGEGEIEPFLNFVKDLKKNENVGIIFISHKIEEVFSISDKIAVFTDGKNVMTKEITEITQDECIQAMLRSRQIDPIVVEPKDMSGRQVIIRTTEDVYDGKPHHILFEGRAGEVVGFYGQVGSGRTEYAEHLVGIRKSQSCSYEFCGEQINDPTPLGMIRKGMILTPELRANAVFRSLSRVDNVCNLFLDKKLTNGAGFVNKKLSAQFTREVLKENNVKHASIAQPISDLSGGNMQKLIIGRSVKIDHIRMLIFDEPTVGMDVGAKHEVYLQCRQLADKDLLCVFISSELEELLTVCDRICVFAKGDIVDTFDRKEFDKARILETAIRGHKL